MQNQVTAAAVGFFVFVASACGTESAGTASDASGGPPGGCLPGQQLCNGVCVAATAICGGDTGGAGGTGGGAVATGTTGGASAGGASSGGASSGGMGGTTGAGGFVGGGAGGGTMAEPLDCGANGTALENHGPPANRVNYVIVGDGYSEAELQPGATLDQHLEAAMTKRFSDPVGQPYLRRRPKIMETESMETQWKRCIG